MDDAGLDASERSLLERAVQGDVEAFSELVRTHYPAIRVYLGSHVHDHAALDDLAQDVFLRAFRGLPTLRHAVAFRGWLIGIARNRALEHLRELVRRDVIGRDRFQEMFAQAQVAFLDAEDDEEGQGGIDLVALRRCLGGLPAQSARLVEEHYLKGRSIVSLAAEANRSAGSVRMALLRLRESLRDCIRRRHVSESGT
jgi:RNA polymerase sigma-70 factor (ECF subfamily)